MRTRRSVNLAIAGLMLLAAVGPVIAQDAPKDVVPFKATLSGPLLPAFTIPTDAPIAVNNGQTTGQADELGQVTYYEHFIAHLGTDGLPIFISDGIGALVAANGDAVFLQFAGGRPVQAPVIADFGYTIVGGRGRFRGARGSGVFRCVRDLVRNDLTPAAVRGIVRVPAAVVAAGCHARCLGSRSLRMASTRMASTPRPVDVNRPSPRGRWEPALPCIRDEPGDDLIIEHRR